MFGLIRAADLWRLPHCFLRGKLLGHRRLLQTVPSSQEDKGQTTSCTLGCTGMLQNVKQQESKAKNADPYYGHKHWESF